MTRIWTIKLGDTEYNFRTEEKAQEMNRWFRSLSPFVRPKVYEAWATPEVMATLQFKD